MAERVVTEGWPTLPPERIENGEQIPMDEPFDEWVYRMLTDAPKEG